MSYVTLAEAKAHLAVIHSDDDAVIQQCLDAAEDYAAAYMGRAAIADAQHCPWRGGNDCTSSSESEPQTVPPAVVQAILMLCAGYYEDRAATLDAAKPENPAVARMLHFHRVGLGF